MLANRQVLVSGTVTEFTFDHYGSNSVLVKNETAGAVCFCDGEFDILTSAVIPPFSWQVFHVAIHIDQTPLFTVYAEAAGDVEIDFGSPCMGALCYPAFDAAGMIPHTLTIAAGENTTLTASLIRLHGQTLDLETPVTLTSGATVFSGDVITFAAAATVEGFHPALTINGDAVELTDGATTFTVSGNSTASVAAVEDVGA